MKNLILLDNHFAPAKLAEGIREWVDYYNHQRYHETIDSVTLRGQVLRKGTRDPEKEGKGPQ